MREWYYFRCIGYYFSKLFTNSLLLINAKLEIFPSRKHEVRFQDDEDKRKNVLTLNKALQNYLPVQTEEKIRHYGLFKIEAGLEAIINSRIVLRRPKIDYLVNTGLVCLQNVQFLI